MRNVIASIVIASLAGTALAVNPGDIVFTNQNNTSIQLLSNPGGSNTLSTLLTLPGLPFGASGSLWRPAGITADNHGRYYFGNQSFDQSNQTRPNNGIFAVDNLFGGAPTVSTFVGTPDTLGANDVDFDPANNGLVWVQNPFQLVANENIPDGLNGTLLSNPTNLQFYDEVTTGTRPFYEAGVFTVKDPNSNDFFVTAVNGGVGPGFSDQRASALWRLSPNYANPAASTLTLVKDFTSDPALTNPIRFLRGITAVPGTNDLYVTHTGVNGIPDAVPGVYKITLNPDGTYGSLTLINSGIFGPEAIEYNPFTNKLVVSAFNDVNLNGFAEEGRIYQLDLDGSNLEVLAEGVHARDFHIVPAPGAAALAGLATLAALRRRRA